MSRCRVYYFEYIVLFLSTILPSSEMKPKLKDTILKLIAKAMSKRYIPFTVNNFKSNILKNKI
jgi:hypothetical protein